MALWLEAFDRVLKEIKELVGLSKEKEQKAFAACEAIETAANKTAAFLQENTRKKLAPNLELSAVWMDAAKAVRELDRNMHTRLLGKAEYWSNPKDWTDEKVDSANIRLDALRKDSEKILKAKK